MWWREMVSLVFNVSLRDLSSTSLLDDWTQRPPYDPNQHCFDQSNIFESSSLSNWTHSHGELRLTPWNASTAPEPSPFLSFLIFLFLSQVTSGIYEHLVYA